jgi:hypothetical protein
LTIFDPNPRDIDYRSVVALNIIIRESPLALEILGNTSGYIGNFFKAQTANVITPHIFQLSLLIIISPFGSNNGYLSRSPILAICPFLFADPAHSFVSSPHLFADCRQLCHFWLFCSPSVTVTFSVQN